MDPLTWAAIIGGGARLGSGLLQYLGAGQAGDRQLEASREAQESAERMSAAEMLMANRRYNQNMQLTLGALGQRYASRLPIANRHMSGLPSRDEYMASMRGGWQPMSDEDLNWLMKHGESRPPGWTPEAGDKTMGRRTGRRV